MFGSTFLAPLDIAVAIQKSIKDITHMGEKKEKETFEEEEEEEAEGSVTLALVVAFLFMLMIIPILIVWVRMIYVAFQVQGPAQGLFAFVTPSLYVGWNVPSLIKFAAPKRGLFG